MRTTMMILLLLGTGCLLGTSCAKLLVDKHELFDIRRAVLDALSFLEPLRCGPDGEHGNGGHDRERMEKTAQRVTEGLGTCYPATHGEGTALPPRERARPLGVRTLPGR